MVMPAAARRPGRDVSRPGELRRACRVPGQPSLLGEPPVPACDTQRAGSAKMPSWKSASAGSPSGRVRA